MHRKSSRDLPIMGTVGALTTLTGDTVDITVLPKGKKAFPLFAPGQFYQLSVPGGGEAPFSPVNCPASEIPLRFCIRNVGHTTALIQRLRPGDPVALRGPFGTPFPLSQLRGKDIVIMAGGLGIVPLSSLFSALAADCDHYGRITLMYGAKEPSLLLYADELLTTGRKCAAKVLFTVELARNDAPPELACNLGLIHELLDGHCPPAESSCAIVCGPPALFRCLVPRLVSRGFKDSRIILSLERRMQCGVGRCCHCGIGTLLCCTDGPVFSWKQLKNIEGAL
jgi:NAD(P)H-flavin reductase